MNFKDIPRRVRSLMVETEDGCWEVVPSFRDRDPRPYWQGKAWNMRKFLRMLSGMPYDSAGYAPRVCSNYACHRPDHCEPTRGATREGARLRARDHLARRESLTLKSKYELNKTIESLHARGYSPARSARDLRVNQYTVSVGRANRDELARRRRFGPWTVHWLSPVRNRFGREPRGASRSATVGAS